MGLVLIVLLLLLTRTAAAAEQGGNTQQLLPPVDPESKLYARMAGLVVPYGYPLEEHFVETVSAHCCSGQGGTNMLIHSPPCTWQVDGYILRMFRIPHGRNEPSLRHQPPTAATRRQLLLSPDGHLSRHSMQNSPGGAAAAATAAAAESGSREPTGPLSATPKKPVVHIQHGLLGSSTDFVLNGHDNSLPMILADAGGCGTCTYALTGAAHSLNSRSQVTPLAA